MTTIVVGDLHGKHEIVSNVLEKAKDKYNVVFMGDYLDSFDIKVIYQIRTLDLVLEAIKENPETVIGLLGNHELSYLNKRHRCSGYKPATQIQVNQRDLSPLREYLIQDGFLLTHAGISKLAILHASYSEINDLPQTEAWMPSFLEKVGKYNVGPRRGGTDYVGGIFWCDWFSEFEPIENIPQVVGHTGYRPPGEHKGILQKGNSYNVDCLDHVEEFLLLDKGKATVVKLDDL